MKPSLYSKTFQSFRVAIRPFELADAEGVNALHDDIGWAAPTHDQWIWLSDNPARGNAPMGWVIDNNGRIDGFIGSFRQTHYRQAARFSTATSHSVIVSPRAKGGLRDLIQPFLDQKDVFAVSILNANEVGSPIYRKLGIKPLASPLHDVKLSWILAPTITLISKWLRLAATRYPALYPVLAERFTPRSITLFDGRMVRWPTGVHVLNDLSDSSSLGSLWQALKAEGQLVVDRSPAILRWRLSIPGLSSPPLLLGYHDDQGLCAYAMAQMSKTGPLDVPALEIIDMVSLERTSAQALPVLLKAVKTAAYKMGAAKVRLPLVSPQLYKALANKTGMNHTEGGWGHAFAHFNAPQEQFADWQPTPFEGSYGFTLRQPRLKPKTLRRQKGEQALAVSES